ncbi:MAG: ATPase P [Thermotaleaceae bacterium]
MFIDIPGRKILEIKNLVFDYNGTLGVDGKLINGIGQKLRAAKELYNIYVITADTYGTAVSQCRQWDIAVMVFSGEQIAKEKRKYVSTLGAHETICIGNGVNDIEMFEEGALSIAVIGEEGCAGKLLCAADIIVKDIKDALDLVLNPKRMKATLRG